jgi:osmoprotectant transport system ATP-binding protein
MLMDEPFGAIDPVVRHKIQEEFLRLQQEVRKTIVIVTHDLDEAILMGDKVAVLAEGGRLAQYGPPEELLSAPADAFVAEFVGSDTGIRRLALRTVRSTPILPLAEAARHGYGLTVDEHGRPLRWFAGGPAWPVVRQHDTLREALSELIAAGGWCAPVVDDDGRAIGVISIDALQRALQMPPARERQWAGA